MIDSHEFFAEKYFYFIVDSQQPLVAWVRTSGNHEDVLFLPPTVHPTQGLPRARDCHIEVFRHEGSWGLFDICRGADCPDPRPFAMRAIDSFQDAAAMSSSSLHSDLFASPVEGAMGPSFSVTAPPVDEVPPAADIASVPSDDTSSSAATLSSSCSLEQVGQAVSGGSASVSVGGGGFSSAQGSDGMAEAVSSSSSEVVLRAHFSLLQKQAVLCQAAVSDSSGNAMRQAIRRAATPCHNLGTRKDSARLAKAAPVERSDARELKAASHQGCRSHVGPDIDTPNPVQCSTSNFPPLRLSLWAALCHNARLCEDFLRVAQAAQTLAALLQGSPVLFCMRTVRRSSVPGGGGCCDDFALFASSV